MSDAGSKTCVSCGVDCSDRPRVKDRYGRYLCRACYEARKAQRPTESDVPTTGGHPVDPDAPTGEHAGAGAVGYAIASGPAVGGAGAGGAGAGARSSGGPSDDDVMRALLSEPTQPGTEPCPQCRSRIPVGAVLCANCGLNLKTGKTLSTRVLKPLEEKPAKGGGGGGRTTEIPVWAPAVAFAAAHAGAGYYSSMHETVFWGWLLVGVIGFYITYIWNIVASFQEGDGVWGWVGVLGVFCCWPAQIVFLVRSLLQTHRSMLVWMTLINLLGHIAATVMGYQLYDFASLAGSP